MPTPPENRRAIAEIVGPSGIGKTTLYLDSMAEWSASWAGRGDLQRLSLDIPDERVSSPIHEKLLFLKARNLQDRQTSTLQKLKIMRYLSEVALIDLALTATTSRRPWFLDEGLFHNFAFEILSLGEEIAPLVADRIFFFLCARDPRAVVDRIRQRQRQSGYLMTLHAGKSDDGLVSSMEDSLQRFEQLACLTESLGGRAYRLFIEDGAASNRAAVCNGLKLPQSMI